MKTKDRLLLESGTKPRCESKTRGEAGASLEKGPRPIQTQTSNTFFINGIVQETGNQSRAIYLYTYQSARAFLMPFFGKSDGSFKIGPVSPIPSPIPRPAPSQRARSEIRGDGPAGLNASANMPMGEAPSPNGTLPAGIRELETAGGMSGRKRRPSAGLLLEPT